MAQIPDNQKDPAPTASTDSTDTTMTQITIQTILNRLDALEIELKNHLQNLVETKNAAQNHTKTPITRPHHTATTQPLHKIFTPELSYLVHITRLRDEFRRGFYLAHGKLKLLAAQKGMLYGYEVTGYQSKGNDVIIPSAALFRDIVSLYGIDFKSDYRADTRARSFYMKGVMDAGNDNAPYKTNASCYVIDMQAPLSSTVIDATEAYWRSISPEEEAMRIISKADMLRLCAEFRAGTKSPQNVPWRVLTHLNGDPVDPSTPPANLLNPKRITVQGYEQQKELVSSDDDWPEDFSQD